MNHIEEFNHTDFATFCLQRLLPIAVYKAQIYGKDSSALFTTQIAISKTISAAVNEILHFDAPGDQDSRMICHSRFTLITYRPEKPIEGMTALHIKIDEEIELEPAGEFINVRADTPQVEFYTRHKTNKDEFVSVDPTAEIITAWRAEMEKAIDGNAFQIFDMFHGRPNAEIPEHS